MPQETIGMQTVLVAMSMRHTCCIAANYFSVGFVADLVPCHPNGQPVALQMVLAMLTVEVNAVVVNQSGSICGT